MNESAYHAILRRLGHTPVGAGSCTCCQPLPLKEPATSEGVAVRIAAFRTQFESWAQAERAGVPLLALPDAVVGAGLCFSCGETLPRGRTWRCEPCEQAVRVVLGMGP